MPEPPVTPEVHQRTATEVCAVPQFIGFIRNTDIEYGLHRLQLAENLGGRDLELWGAVLENPENGLDHVGVGAGGQRLHGRSGRLGKRVRLGVGPDLDPPGEARQVRQHTPELGLVRRTVGHTPVDDMQARMGLSMLGLSQSVVDAMVEMYQAIESGHLVSSETRSEETTTPTTMADWAADVMAPMFA